MPGDHSRIIHFAYTAAYLGWALTGVTSADVFNLPAGQTSLNFVSVGDAGNAADVRYSTPGYGGVNYNYQIGKHEVTAGQYTEFLNAVAKTDTYNLYNTGMGGSFGSCHVQRTGSPGSYVYTVPADYANRPVNFVSWGDAARFANWLSNGQPIGPQGPSTTESGSYSINGITGTFALAAVLRSSNAKYVIPSEDEWYKAAYYDVNKPGGPGYWKFATGTDSVPSNILSNPDPGNNANFYSVDGIGHTIGSPYYLTQVGAFSNSKSRYGTFDQGGNVWEWNEALGPDLFRVMRGSAYDNYSIDYLSAGGRNTNRLSGYEASEIGFRIVLVPEPFTGLLLLAALPLFHRRRTNRISR